MATVKHRITATTRTKLVTALPPDTLAEIDNQILDGTKTLSELYLEVFKPLGISDRAFYRYASHVCNRTGERFSIWSIQRQIADLLPHDRPVAARRVAYVRQFMEEDRKRGAANRAQTRRDVAERLTRDNPGDPVTPERLSVLEHALYRDGVAGLVGLRPRIPFPTDTDLQAMAELPVGDLLASVAALIKAISQKLKSVNNEQKARPDRQRAKKESRAGLARNVARGIGRRRG